MGTSPIPALPPHKTPAQDAGFALPNPNRINTYKNFKEISTMLTKIKEYFAFRKLRRDALTLLILNGSRLVTDFKNTSDQLNELVKKQAEASSAKTE